MHFSLSVIGWIHTIASTVAMIVGAFVLLWPKGNALHKRRGRIYVVAMLVANVTALFIYSLGIFRVFHWMAAGTLLFILGGYLAALLHKPARSWVHFHVGGMILSYYMIIGGAVNEAFLHLDSLRQLAPAIRARAVGMSQFAVMLIFSALLIYMLTVSRRRHIRN